MQAGVNVYDGNTELVNASVFGLGLGKLVKLNIPSVSEEGIQQIKYTGNWLSRINSGAGKLIINIYNNSSENIRLDIRLKYSSREISTTLKVVTLKPGLNKIESHNFYGMNWADYKSVEYILFQVGELGDSARDYLYIADTELYLA